MDAGEKRPETVCKSKHDRLNHNNAVNIHMQQSQQRFTFGSFAFIVSIYTYTARYTDRPIQDDRLAGSLVVH